MAIAAVAAALGLVWVLGPGAAWMLEHFDGVSGLTGKDLAAALDVIRGRALNIATGLIALVAVYYTARNAATARHTFELSEQGHRLSEQGHVTDRYTKAIEQLGSDKLDIRLGGIYALERIARDSARDHPTIMEVLAAYIREHSQDANADQTKNDKTSWPGRRLRTDLQAVLTVIGRRTVAYDLEGAPLELAYASLACAHLVDANLAHAFLSNVDLTGAFLADTNFTKTFLGDADLTNALLHRADLTDTNLTNANLNGADLTGADLTNANLDGVDLDDVIGLSEHQRSLPSFPRMSLPLISDMVPPARGESEAAEGPAAG